MSRRLYAIGDIHGHMSALADLWVVLNDDGMDPHRDTVIFLGDYVDRGPDSLPVVETVAGALAMYPHWRALRGNHEQMLLDAMRAGPEDWGTWAHWWYQGGRETAASFAGKPVSETQPKDASASIPGDVLDWIETLPELLIRERYAFAHAGVRPHPRWWWESDPHDLIWIRDEFLDSDFDFEHVIVHGHTPVEEPAIRPNRIGIDTILKGGYLTAVELSGDEPRFIRSDGKWGR